MRRTKAAVESVMRSNIDVAQNEISTTIYVNTDTEKALLVAKW
jgi:hypothetical protein